VRDPLSEHSPITVVVVDDHEMILQSVVRLLAADPQIVVVGTALTGAQGIDVTKRIEPDVLVIDFHLPDMEAPEAIRQLREAKSDVKVVTISGSERPGALYASIRAGSSAWVRKTRAIHELRDAIRHVAAGWPFANEELEATPKQSELVVHYQPIVSLVDGHIVGFEALVRWQHPERGLLYPESFLPYAEETGYIEEIDRWIRRKAVAQLARWQILFPSEPRLWMSVNLSASDLLDPYLFESISDILQKAKIAPKDLVVEITETVLLDDSDATMKFLTKLNEIGVRLALDDFGTAFSSISYVRRFPFDHLKLDLSFTAELPNSIRSMLLVEEILHMAESLRMTGIAEGIERQDQLDALRDLGFDYGQGYLFSGGVSASQCERLLAKSNLLPAVDDDALAT
jgi:EAL domain-containing protein (putative c-di-GMP-specific phosphodiesterase class I)